MDCYGANRLMNRPFVENRPVVAITPRGKVKDGFLIGHDGVNATIKRSDGKRDFACSLDDVKYLSKSQFIFFTYILQDVTDIFPECSEVSVRG